MKPSRLPAFLRRALALATLTSLGSSPALAATWYWDANPTTAGPQQAAGTWTNTGATWWDGTATVPWVNSAGNIAHFGTDTGVGITDATDAARTITVSGTVSAAALVLNSTTQNSYILSGGTIALANGSTIDVKGGDGTDATTKRHRITSTISGANINIARTTTSSLAMVRLFGTNTWTGNLTLSSTATEGIFVEAMGGGALNSLTNVSVGVNSSMILAAASTFTPGFSINGTGAGGNRGAIRFDTNGATISGAVTLDGSATINALAGITATISGPINQVASSRALTLNATGGGTLVLSANNNFLGPVTLTSGVLNLNGNNTFAGTVAIGGNTLSLLGENQFTGTGQITMNGGTLTIGSPNSIKALGSVAKPIVLTGTTNTIVAVVGPGGFSEAEFANLPTFATSGTGSAAYGLSTQTDINWTGALFGNLAFAKGGSGTLSLVGTRSDSGGITIRDGNLRITDIANGGQNSSIGSSSAAAASLVLSGGRLLYAGPQASTDRLFTMTASAMIDSSGSGPLTFSNTGSIAHVGTTARTLTLSGYAPGENRISSVITNAGTTAVSVTKQGTASWTLSGTNTHTGATRNNGGTLILDYTTGGDPISTGAVQQNAGEIVVRGTTAGTTETFATYQLGANQHTYGSLRLAGRVNLTITNLTNGSQAQRADLIDLSSNAANVVTVSSAPVGSAIRVVNNVLQVNAAADSSARANIILKDQEGKYGFPTLSGTTSGTLTRLNTFTASTGTFSSNAVNYRVTKGIHTVTGPLLYNTITLDSTETTVSTANEIELHLNTYAFSPTESGKGILLTGNNNILINNADGQPSNTQPVWFHNYLAPGATLTIQGDYLQQYLMFSGPGFTDYRGYRFTDNFYLFGSLVRISQSQQLAAAVGNFRISSGGVLEVNADLFGGTLTPAWDEVDFVKPVRITPSGGIAFYGDSGMSAYMPNATATSKRIVHFGIADSEGVPVSQLLTWGTGRFLTQPDSDLDGDYTFKLSSPLSNAMLELRNSINLNGRSRNIEVANGSANIDALLTGVLSGSDASGLIKSGEGTLQLTGLNTYKGETRVQAGTLIVGTNNLHAQSTLSIITAAGGGSGKLNVTSDLSVAAVRIDGVLQPAGKVTSPHVTGTGSLYVGGALTPYQQWAASSGLGSGESAGDFDADFDGIKNVVEYAVGSNPKSPNGSVLTKVAGSPVAVRFNRATTNPARTDLTLVLEANTDLSATWTPLATSTAGAAMVSNQGTSIVISEVSGVVTVTDNRALGTKTFYRLRATVP